MQRRIEGPEVAGRRVLAVEDTSTTGGSPLEAVRRAEGSRCGGGGGGYDRGPRDRRRRGDRRGGTAVLHRLHAGGSSCVTQDATCRRRRRAAVGKHPRFSDREPDATSAVVRASTCQNLIGCQHFGVRAVEQRDELEIETRLRAALQARSELVTHSTLRPGIPPNEHTAGVRARRECLVVLAPAVGARDRRRRAGRRRFRGCAAAVGLRQVPGQRRRISRPAAGGPCGSTSAPSGTPTGATPTPGRDRQARGLPGERRLDRLHPRRRLAGHRDLGDLGLRDAEDEPEADPGRLRLRRALPCGVDGLYVKTDAVHDRLAAEHRDQGHRLVAGLDVLRLGPRSARAAKPGSSDMVKASMLLRSTAKYALAGRYQTGQASPVTADYHEWAVACDSGHGVQPMLWKLNAAPGAAGSGDVHGRHGRLGGPAVRLGPARYGGLAAPGELTGADRPPRRPDRRPPSVIKLIASLASRSHQAGTVWTPPTATRCSNDKVASVP